MHGDDVVADGEHAVLAVWVRREKLSGLRKLQHLSRRSKGKRTKTQRSENVLQLALKNRHSRPPTMRATKISRKHAKLEGLAGTKGLKLVSVHSCRDIQRSGLEAQTSVVAFRRGNTTPHLFSAKHGRLQLAFCSSCVGGSNFL